MNDKREFVNREVRHSSPLQRHAPSRPVGAHCEGSPDAKQVKRDLFKFSVAGTHFGWVCNTASAADYLHHLQYITVDYPHHSQYVIQSLLIIRIICNISLLITRIICNVIQSLLIIRIICNAIQRIACLQTLWDCSQRVASS